MSRAIFIISMLIFSTIGVFVSPLSVPTSVTAFFRALCGTLVLSLVLLVTRRKLDRAVLLKNAKYLIPAGIALGFNWVLLFEGYRLTGVATATMCYYLAPALVILLSPVFLREKAGFLKIFCAIVALAGMIPVSGILSSQNKINARGVIVSVCAAVLYAFIVILNKRVKNLSGIETTVVQLGISAVVMGLYVFVREPVGIYANILPNIKPLLLLGIVHTGIAYLLYFSSIKSISAADCAIFSYIDPAGALILSYTLLGEAFTWQGFLGIVMIFGASILAELPRKRRVRKPRVKGPADI